MERRTYLLTHFFDFIAIVPALAFVNYGFFAEGAFVWLILVARFVQNSRPVFRRWICNTQFSGFGGGF